jgi:hypothetical protein
VNYFVTRNGQQYGPYTLADLQRYVASGDIALTDLASSEGMSEPAPVSQIIGTITVPATQPQIAVLPESEIYPDPPNLHWALVLVFGVLTCGLFSVAWDLVQAAWMKRVDPRSNAIVFYGIAAAALLGMVIFDFHAGYTHHRAGAGAGIFNLAYGVLMLIGRFSLRSSLEQHFTSAEPIGLTLSGVMTFFFGGIYFQYHFNQIVQSKRAAQMRFTA